LAAGRGVEVGEGGRSVSCSCEDAEVEGDGSCNFGEGFGEGDGFDDCFDGGGFAFSFSRANLKSSSFARYACRQSC
jgi:hypothetical protein